MSVLDRKRGRYIDGGGVEHLYALKSELPSVPSIPSFPLAVSNGGTGNNVGNGLWRKVASKVNSYGVGSGEMYNYTENSFNTFERYRSKVWFVAISKNNITFNHVINNAYENINLSNANHFSDARMIIGYVDPITNESYADEKGNYLVAYQINLLYVTDASAPKAVIRHQAQSGHLYNNDDFYYFTSECMLLGNDMDIYILERIYEEYRD